MEQLKTAVADAQAWFSRLTTRERRLVAFASTAVGVFILLMMTLSFSSSAAGYRRRTSEKLRKLAEVQSLAESYGEAQAERMAVERELTGNNVKLISYIDEKGTAAGLSITTQIPKNEVPIGDGKILESSVELTLTDIPLNKLVDFLANIESGPGVVKVSSLRIEPRVASETLTAWATITTYRMKQ